MTPDDFGLNAIRLTSGFAGAVAHVFAAKRFEPLSMVGSAVVGTLTANYLGPAAQHFAPAWIGDFGAAFLVGYFALLILQGIDVLVRYRLRGIIATEREKL